MHLGRRRHGADDITKGHRLNLIMVTARRCPRRDRRNYAQPASCHRRPPFTVECLQDAAPSQPCSAPAPGVPAQWNYNKEFRASPEFRARSFAREGSPPDAECISDTHDRDYEAVSGGQRPAPHLASSAWCPPPPAEYDGFVGLEGRWAGHPHEAPR